MENLDIIACPSCGAEYLPAEIYVPNAFFGRPEHIERDSNNKIVSVIGDGSCYDETYICDYCNKKFKITAQPRYSCGLSYFIDMDSESVTKLKKDKLTMRED